MFETWVFGMILTADHTPKDGVLGLGVKHHTIEIEQRSLKLFFLHIMNFGAKVMFFNEKFAVFPILVYFCS